MIREIEEKEKRAGREREKRKKFISARSIALTVSKRCPRKVIREGSYGNK